MDPNKTSSTKQIIESRSDKTTNHEGGLAFTMSDKMTLYSQVASWLVGEPKFYADTDEDEINDQSGDAQIKALIRRVAKNDPEFILKLAVYARKTLYLRTAPQVLLVECSLINEAKPFVRKYTPAIVQRADELTTCVAYLVSVIGQIGNGANKGSMPASLKRGLADAFNNFNAYQLQKYNNKRKMVKLVDVLKLVHPIPKDKAQSKIFKQLLEDKLPTPDTWETIISEGSNTKNWTKASKVMPIMATLRNLRNMLTHKVDMKPVLKKLQDPDIILKSKQFPFRFYSAKKAVEEGVEGFGVNPTIEALEAAIEISAKNVPRIRGNTMISADNSYSMTNKISEKSMITHEEIANLFMAFASRVCDDVICSIFGDTFAVKSMPKTNGIIANMQTIRNDEVGSSTNAYLAIQYLRENKIKADRFILFSDMQCYDNAGWQDQSVYEEVLKYRREVNPNFYFYSVDTSGYGTAQIPENDPKSLLIAGWSDKILKYISVFEESGKSALDEIEKISL